MKAPSFWTAICAKRRVLFEGLFWICFVLNLSSCSGIIYSPLTPSPSGSEFTKDWPFDALSDASYNCITGDGISHTGSDGLNNCNQELTGGVAKLSPANQTDNSSALFQASGSNFNGTTWDGTKLRLANDGGCDGANTNCSEFDSSWTPQHNSLANYWKLNGSSAPNIDSATCAASAGVTFTTSSKLGSHAGLFNGTSGDIDCGTGTYLYPFTLSAWIKFANAPTGTNMILGRLDEPGTWYHNFWWQIGQTANKMDIGFHNGTTWVKYGGTNTTWTAGKWYHVAATLDGSTSHLYINGVEDPVTYNTVAGTPANNGTYTLAIGSDLPSNRFYFDGTIDEVALWSTALSATEIGTIYARQAPTYSGTFTSRVMDGFNTANSWTELAWTPTLPFYKALPDAGVSESQASYSSLYNDQLMTGIAGLWHLNGTYGANIGNNAVIAAAFGSNGTFNNANNSAYPLTGYVTGKFNQGITFDGVDDKIDLNSNFTWTKNDSFTISLWVNPSDVVGNKCILGKANWEYAMNMTGNALNFWYWNTGSAVDIDLQTTILPQTWSHIVVTYDPVNKASMYKDGKSVAVDTSISGTLQSRAETLKLGYSYYNLGASAYFKGSLDEVGIWNRALDPTEILQLYRRGANRIKFQVRSCGDNTCAGENWKGPDNTDQSYFSELYNTAANALTGAVSNGLPTMTFSNFGSLSVANNRYFQYRAIMESDDANSLCNYGSGATACSPELKSVSVGPTHYDSSIPAISNATGETYSYLTSLAESLGASCAGGVRYLLSPDNSTWYYYNTVTSSWTLASSNSGAAGYALANAASALSATVMNSFATQAATGSIYFRAFLKSDGTQPCEINNLSIKGNR